MKLKHIYTIIVALLLFTGCAENEIDEDVNGISHELVPLRFNIPAMAEVETRGTTLPKKETMVGKTVGIFMLTEEEYKDLLEGSIKYVGNDGVAWGFLAIGKWWLVVLCAVILILIGFIIYKTKPQNLLEKISYGMVIGGALGNVYDRIAHGFVIDFIDVQFMEFAVFNIADCFIVVGSILLACYIMVTDSKKEEVDTGGND